MSYDYDNAAYLKDRYRLLRDRGLCVDCKGDSPAMARCEGCRSKGWSTRRPVPAQRKAKAA